MIELATIRPYVEKMAYTISIVLEMDVLICDRFLQIIGDYDHKGEVCGEVEYLQEDSVISKAIMENNVVIYNNAKEESAGCRMCNQRSSCRTETIIAYPLIKGGIIFGGIGIYSQERRQKNKLISQRDPLIEFIANIGDLIITKLEEETHTIEMLASNEKMQQIIETLDFALVNVDEQNRVLYYNRKFEEILTKNTSMAGADINSLFDGLHTKGLQAGESRVYVKKGRQTTEYEVTYSPVVIEDSYKGALLYFKEASQLLAKANQLISPVKSGSFDEIIGSSQALTKVKEDAQSFAKSYSNILISGESGTGKEVFASAIHNASKCAEGPFVAVNCAAIPDNLLESELFGYVEGAFTGAAKGGRAGKFEIANNGTLFLDEIGELPIHLQPKLLRALQEKKIQRVGSNRSIDINIRIIAATNRDLPAMMKNGEFREDLYYRLSVIPIKIPPLRERPDDISLLADYFLNMYKDMLEKDTISGFDGKALALLCSYDWPGNVRELQNVIEYAVNKCRTSSIMMADIPDRVRHCAGISGFMPIPLKELERDAIRNALSYCGETPEGKEKAAEMIGISRATLYRKLKEYNL